ncbi:MAG TPA: DnaJ domain-containing protein [Nitrospirota bacterium]|nr:DnaJ domain-containing protein [Nitrospirota bacterium]
MAWICRKCNNSNWQDGTKCEMCDYEDMTPYYQTLGIIEDASLEEVGQAYSTAIQKLPGPPDNSQTQLKNQPKVNALNEALEKIKASFEEELVQNKNQNNVVGSKTSISPQIRENKIPGSGDSSTKQITLDRNYQLLSINPNATKEEIRQAYRDLSSVWNPNRFENNPSLQQKARVKSKELDEAYENIIINYTNSPVPPSPQKNIQAQSLIDQQNTTLKSGISHEPNPQSVLTRSIPSVNYQPKAVISEKSISPTKMSPAIKLLLNFVGFTILVISLGIGKWLGTSEYFFPILFGSGVGAICGLLPFFIAKRRRSNLQSIGIWACIISGIIYGVILALPVAIILTIIIVVQNPQ